LVGTAGALTVATACLPGTFDALADAAPVRTVELGFPGEPNAELAVALTVPADDESRGRVLFGDGDSAMGWLRIDLDGRVELRFATFSELAEIGSEERPTLTGLGLVEDTGVAEALVRVAATDELPERVVRFRVADFSRVAGPELDAWIYPWVLAELDTAPALTGPIAGVQLDDGLAELLSASEAGLFVWDALATKLPLYEQARAEILAEDPAAFDADPAQGFGLTHCPGLRPTALAGGAVLPGGARAALALEGETLTFVAALEVAQLSAVGAPIYDCARDLRTLPGPASSLAVVDLGLDGDDDLLVGAPEAGRVWVYENEGTGLPETPSRTLEGEADFGASVGVVELGGEAPQVIVVGAPGAKVEDELGVGRVSVFDAQTGELLRTIEDLEPRADSHHGLGVHGVDVPGREELVVSGARELRVHWSILAEDPGHLGN
jgi:hypothetical protein